MMLRMKVWTAPDGCQFVMSIGLISPTRPDMMTVFAMSDEGTVMMRMATDEFNALPYFWFTQGESAKRLPPRVPEEVVL